MKRVHVLIISFLCVFAVAFAGTLFTDAGSEWYSQNKPSFTPPNYVFPIAWTILYILIALSIYFAWINAKKNQKKNLLILFGINLIANAVWTPLFFTLQNPLLSFIDLLIILASATALIIYTFKINKISSYLLIPYLIWLILAGFLNLAFLI